MRLVPHLVHVFPSFGKGGTELRIANIINALDGRFRHTILPLDGNATAVTQIRQNVDILTKPATRNALLFVPALQRVLKNARPDLLLTYNWGAIEAVVAARTGNICPVIHNESGFGPDEAHGLKLRRVLARRVILNHVYATVVNSRALLQIALGRYQLPPKRVHFIRNGVDTTRFQPGRNDGLRAALGAAGGDVLFGFVGRHRGEKNLPLLLHAFAKANLTDARLVIAGDGPCRDDLERLVVHLGIGGRVVFPGQIEDPSSLLKALDVFVMSSVTEQTSNALLEAMSTGLPAISTDVGDSRELLNAGAPFIVPSGDVDAYAAALAAVAGNPEMRAMAGAANRARCVNSYSLADMTCRFGTLWAAAAGERGEP